jgi:hypothetical protein
MGEQVVSVVESTARSFASALSGSKKVAVEGRRWARSCRLVADVNGLDPIVLLDAVLGRPDNLPSRDQAGEKGRLPTEIVWPGPASIR